MLLTIPSAPRLAPLVLDLLQLVDLRPSDLSKQLSILLGNDLSVSVRVCLEETGHLGTIHTILPSTLISSISTATIWSTLVLLGLLPLLDSATGEHLLFLCIDPLFVCFHILFLSLFHPVSSPCSHLSILRIPSDFFSVSLLRRSLLVHTRLLFYLQFYLFSCR